MDPLHVGACFFILHKCVGWGGGPFHLYDMSLSALIHEPSVQIQASPTFPLKPHTAPDGNY